MSDSPSCPLCGNPTVLVADTVRFGRKADVRRCQACTLVFLDQNSFAFPKDFYQAEYHQTYLTHVEPDAFDPRAYYGKMSKATAKWAEKVRGMLTGEEALLDMGCSTGHLLMAVKDKAAKVYGHDLNEKETAFCKEELGLDVDTRPLHERFGENAFDLVTMIFVLEHIADPVPFLRYLKRFLKPGGKMAVLVPNIADPLVSFYDIPEFRNFYYCWEHVFYYNAATLGMVMDKAGLKADIETIQEYPLANHLNWAYTRAPSDTLAARSGLPAVDLAPGAPQTAWAGLWREFDGVYREFLKKNGFGDRLWCVAVKED